MRAAMIILIALLVIGGGTASVSLAIASWVDDSGTSTTSAMNQSTATTGSAYQIAAQVQAASGEMHSFQLDAQMDMGDGMMAYDMHTAIDEPNGTMYADFRMVTLMPEPLTVQGEMYIIEDCAYMNIEVPLEMSGWSKFCAPGLLEQEAMTTSQVDFLAQFVDVDLLGTEVVDGVECYKLQVVPDMGSIWEWTLGQPGMEDMAGDVEGMEDLMEDMVSDLSIIEWIATDTYFPVKFVMEMTVATEEGSIDMTMTGSVHHINEPMSIELPPEAADAEELPIY